MFKTVSIISVFLAFQIASAKGAESHLFSFDNETGVLFEEGGNGRVEDGRLVIADGTRKRDVENRIILDWSPDALYDTVECSFSFICTKGAEGFSVNLVQNGKDAAGKAGESSFSNEDNAVLSLGFDIYDPPSANWFDEYGNYTDKPQREIYIMYGGREILRVLSPVEFRDEEEHVCRWRISSVPGGAEMDLDLDSASVLKSAFIPHYEVFRFSPVIISKTGEITFYAEMDYFNVACRGLSKKSAEKKSVELADGLEFHGGKRVNRFEALFPEKMDEWSRIVLNVKLDSLQGGFDGWDRCGALYAVKYGKRIQIARFITPFGTGAEWSIDISDFRPLLYGKTEFEAEIDTWIEETEPSIQKGWKLNLNADLYKCRRYLPVKVIPLWSGMYEYGNPERPIYEDVKGITEETGNGRKFVLNLFVTGHGQHPASLNAAEFLPIEENIIINGKTLTDTLWKDDCYLNPLRNQKGTWKFSRAGWAPGSVVDPRKFGPFTADSASVEYRPQDYTNESSDSAKAYLWIDGSIFIY